MASRGRNPSIAHPASLLKAAGRNVAQRALAIVLHPRHLILGFVSFWLRALDETLDVVSAPDAETFITADMLAHASALILGASTTIELDTWLRRQLAFLRATRPEVPIVVISDGDDPCAAVERFDGMNLRGVIPTSSSIEVAAAALNLIAAGGTYIPPAWDSFRHPSQPLPDYPASEHTAPVARLTPRERAVLKLLQRGMPNKIIAHHLGISESTAKAHIHNIIAKLAVHNRTEAALTSHRLQSPAPGEDGDASNVAQPPEKERHGLASHRSRVLSRSH